MIQIRQRLTYANVVSSLALFLVLSGGAAYAAKKISGNQLKGSSVTTAKIRRGAVTASKIRKGAVQTNKISQGAVTNAKLANGAVTLEKLVPGFVAPSAEKLSRAANVSSGGTILAGSIGISQVNLTRPSPGFYCLSGLNPGPAGGVATLDYFGFGEETILIEFAVGQGTVCPAGTQAFVNTRKSKSPDKSEPVDAGFFLVLY